MIGVRALIGASFALMISVGSASAIPIAPNSVTNVVAPNVYIGQAQFGEFQAIDVTYTFIFSPPLNGLSTAVTLDATPNPASPYGITNLFYEWVGITGPVQISDSNGVFLGEIPTTITGLMASSPLVLHVFTGTGNPLPLGSTLNNGGGFQISLDVSQTPLPGAVALFGSVLAGGIGGLQLMRRRRRSTAA